MDKAQGKMAKRKPTPPSGAAGGEAPPSVMKKTKFWKPEPEPEDEEVEEFFAILRRMQGAVKYLKKSGATGVGIWAPETWRAGPESRPVPVVEEAGGSKLVEEIWYRTKRTEVVLDLNASPEETTAGE